MLRPEMKAIRDGSIFTTFSTGLSYMTHYHEKEPYIVYLECSPEDGVQMIVTGEQPRADAEVLCKKTLTRNDLVMLRKMIDNAIVFYDTECKE